MKHLPTLGISAIAFLCGCTQLAPSSSAPIPGAALTGKVHGGQQPVSNALMQLYAVGTTGDGSAARPLIAAIVRTDATGSFNLSAAYTCPSASTQVYLVATGGNPGLSPSTTTNPQLSMMAALGSCGALTSTTFISLNELTTVAAVWALAPYITGYAAIGSATSDAPALATAFQLANQFVSTATGSAPGAVPTGYSSPIAIINTLGNIVAPCINSSGGIATDGSACGNLFQAATPSGGTAPTDTIGAALLIARNPNQNVSNLFALSSANTPFQPALATLPADWTVPLLPTNAIRILFVGDSFTHGRYLPVRTYNSAGVTDENYGLPSSNARAESSTETGPYGGIPGIFKLLTTQAGLSYDVHIEAISSTSLATHISVAQPVIANAQWGAIVLQEISTRPLPPALSNDSSSNPSNFCGSVKTIEKAVHAANATTKVYLYETWARADEAEALGASTYSTNLTSLFTSYHNVYNRAAVLDGSIAGVAAAGDAWQLAIQNGIVTANPYTSSTGPFLWYGLNATNNPTISSADELHPSIYGAYLSALVLYGQITGQDPALFGSAEQAAAALGISTTLAVQLQQIAHTQIYSGTTAPINQSVDPCTVT